VATPLKFGTDGWRAVIAQDYTYANLARVTQGLIDYLQAQHDRPQVMLGYDARFNGQGFAEAVATQLADAGIKVFISPGFVSTPMVSLATMQRQCHMGVVITASHNPPSYSGFKLKGPYGGPAFPALVAEVEGRIPDEVPAVTGAFEAYLDAKQIEYYDQEALYVNHIKQSFDLKAIQAAGFQVGYDAMYGSGQSAIRRLLPAAELLHCEFNPSFMGQAPEPIERNLEPFRTLIREKGLDFGLATDGDADRIGLFDEAAQFVDSHHILLLLIHYLAGFKQLSGKVVYTFSCTGKIAKLCAHYGLEAQVTQIGFKYIGEIMAHEEVLVGGEESGGIAVAGHIPERDGIFIGLVLLEFMAKTGKRLPELIQEVYDIVGSFKMGRNDLHLTNARKQAVMDRCAGEGFSAFGDFRVQRVESVDGYKFHLAEDKWVMIRPSGTEPVLRVYAEGPDDATVRAILAATVGTLEAVQV